ncbi:MAG: hypothetical protein KZQ58_09465 [gamma proteobacterium symbiont of Bathyaustriella thionipta]|nr:hypothetical protein [gamma proteobacterium symbiont of Bathyaustriella thionipta]
MTTLVIQAAESHMVSVLLFSAPLILWLLSRIPSFQKPSRLADFNRRWKHIPMLFILLIYYAYLYQSLYFNQFYTLTASPQSDWVLQYRMPHSSRTLDKRQIIKIDKDDMNTIGKGMARLQIRLENGDLLRSARLNRQQAKEYVTQLNKLL